MSNFYGIRAGMRLTALAALLLLVAFGASAQTVRYVHTDGLGSVVLVTDKDRNVVERSEYEPYGNLLNRSMTDGPGYTGHVTDASTGLVYMQQRYYDEKIGIFLSVDPVTASKSMGAFNRYRYAASNPYKFSDPDGRAPSSEILYGAGGRTGGGISAEGEIKNNLLNDGERKFASGTELSRAMAAQHVIDVVRKKVESVGNSSPDAAAKYFVKVFQPVSTRFGLEISANIKLEVRGSNSTVEGQWYLRQLSVGTKFDRQTGIGFMSPSDGGGAGTFNIHTHPLIDINKGQWNYPFSTDDLVISRWQHDTSYVSDPTMRLYKSEAGGWVEEVK
ncbi:hypothetical protein NG825_20585 [Xanthomonas sacchari]|uniref:RHS repeat domain-containing protein n=1 Tax=uncultured Xanthomonas sp. TaxID=152831 RepID=UPI0024CC44D6|nr:RHS repeat-associated core domain-containing protein [uncultured Xanthomonas sp.]UYK76762.1 hypothetical protein NG825_20585 [Xanthomonas sacchari]